MVALSQSSYIRIRQYALSRMEKCTSAISPKYTHSITEIQTNMIKTDINTEIVIYTKMIYSYSKIYHLNTKTSDIARESDVYHQCL